MDPRTKIKNEIQRLKIPDQTKYYWYFYSIILDGKPCAKFGSSTIHLENRIYSYLMKEHKNQTKNWNSFRIISVVEFRKKKSIQHIENFIKEHAKDYPLNPNQHWNTEQYDLVGVWKEIRTCIENKQIMLAINMYTSDDPNADVEFVIGCIRLPQSPKTKTKTKPQKAMMVVLNLMLTSDFQKISGVGVVLSHRLNENKPYKSMNDLLNVDMIGSCKYNAITDHINALVNI